MPERWNELQWDGQPGHYEVYYLTLTDPATGVGFWIRYTMVAPLPETGEEATCSLWFMAMDPRDPAANVGQKVSFPVSQLHGDRRAVRAARSAMPCSRDRGHDGLARAGRHAASGTSPGSRGCRPTATCTRSCAARRSPRRCCSCRIPTSRSRARSQIGERRIDVAGARGGQAHLWGSKHATRWAWAHCNDFTGPDGDPRSDAFIDGVSVFVPRFGRADRPEHAGGRARRRRTTCCRSGRSP